MVVATSRCPTYIHVLLLSQETPMCRKVYFHIQNKQEVRVKKAINEAHQPEDRKFAYYRTECTNQQVYTVCSNVTYDPQ